MSSDIDVEWLVATGLTDYASALVFMEQRVADIQAGTARELIWLVEHPPVYTAGTSAQVGDLLAPDRFPVFNVGRGGQYTYHGPGQRMVYVMLDLDKRGRDVRRFVSALEQWLVTMFNRLGVTSHTSSDRVGVWTNDSGSEAKIAAIGVRIRRWITFHGAAINIAPDLTHFDGIVACGLPGYAITSLAALGKPMSFTAVDTELASGFPAFLDALSD